MKLETHNSKLLRRIAQLTLLAAFAVLFLGADTDARFTKLGHQMMCMCGCNQVLTSCNHIDCPLSVPMLKQVSQRVDSGDADDLIVQSFVQQYGENVLSEPPAHGFTGLAWAIPGIAFAAGLTLVVLVIRLWRHRVPMAAAPSSGPAMSPDVLDRARRQADRETDD